MPRRSTTQSRAFNYIDAGGHVGPNLQSATNPENGTVTYTYNSDNTVATRIDAKGQKMAYSDDSYGRPTQIRHYPNGTTEDTTQQVNLYYDSYSGAGPNIVGRLAATNGHVREVYGYTPAGELSSKAMSVNGVGEHGSQFRLPSSDTTGMCNSAIKARTLPVRPRLWSQRFLAGSLL